MGRAQELGVYAWKENQRVVGLANTLFGLFNSLLVSHGVWKELHKIGGMGTTQHIILTGMLGLS